MKEIFDKFAEIYRPLKEASFLLGITLPDGHALVSRMNRSPKIVFVGEFKTGKSSLINCLLGQQILPVGAVPTTKLISFLRRGPLQIAFHLRQANEPIIYEPGKQVDLGFDFILEGKSFYEILQETLMSEDNLGKIKFVDIQHPNVPPDAVFIDTPGINDVSKSRSEIVYGVIPEADLVVFVISAIKPFSETERLFLTERILAEDLKKVVFVLNRVDQVEENPELDELCKETEDRIFQALKEKVENTNKALNKNVYSSEKPVRLIPFSARFNLPGENDQSERIIGFQTKKNRGKGKDDPSQTLLREIKNTLSQQEKMREFKNFLRYHLFRAQSFVSQEIDRKLQIAVLDEKQRTLQLEKITAVLVYNLEKSRKLEIRLQGLQKVLLQEVNDEISREFGKIELPIQSDASLEATNQLLSRMVHKMNDRIHGAFKEVFEEFGEEFKIHEYKNSGLRKPEINPNELSREDLHLAIDLSYFGCIINNDVGKFAGLIYLIWKWLFDDKKEHPDFEKEIEKMKKRCQKLFERTIVLSSQEMRRFFIQFLDASQRQIEMIVDSKGGEVEKERLLPLQRVIAQNEVSLRNFCQEVL